MPPKKPTTADGLKAVRKKLGLSQTEAAERWGIKLQTWQSWELGRYQPRGLYLERVEEIIKEAGV